MNSITDFISNIKSISDLQSYDEEATKHTIILRLFSILGWDIFNRDEVFPEYKSYKKEVDYSLRQNQKNLVFVEVKRVNKDLAGEQEQILTYAFQEGVNLAILTNGLTWWFYLPIMSGNWESRKFYTIELNERDPQEIENKFNDLLLKENVVSGKALETARDIYKSKQKDREIKKHLPEAWEKIINEPDEILIELLSEKVESICGYTPPNLTVKNFIKNINKSIPDPPSPYKTPKPRKGKSIGGGLEGIEVFIDSVQKGVKARGIILNKGFLVKKYSQASLNYQGSLRQELITLRKELKLQGILKIHNNILVFNQDYQFNSPSESACVIYGSSINGKDAWKDMNRQSINELEKSKIKNQ